MSPYGDIYLYRKKNNNMEKNRSQTEQRLISSVEELVRDQGFEKLGVRMVADKAGVDKNLIYRYFGSLDGLIYACLKKHDFWSNFPLEIPEKGDLKSYIKELFRKQVTDLRNNDILKRLLRWELSNVNEFVSELRKQREENGLKRIKMISSIVNISFEELAAISSIISGGITYLVILEGNCQYYNGIDIQSDEGWGKLLKGIDNMIDLKYNENGN